MGYLFDGTSVYATNNGDDSVSMYSRNINTGILTALLTPVSPTGVDPIGIVCSPDNLSAYVINSSSNTVSMYSRD